MPWASGLARWTTLHSSLLAMVNHEVAEVGDPVERVCENEDGVLLVKESVGKEEQGSQ